MDLSPRIHLRYNHTKTVEPAPHKMTFYDALYVEASMEQLDKELHIKILLHPKEDVLINELYIEIPYNFQSSDQIFCNGFQSQTESLIYHPQEVIPPLKIWAAKHWQQQGVYRHPHLWDPSANLHSWTYSYIQNFKDYYFLIGSLSEQTGFTIIKHCCHKNIIKVTWEAADFKLTHSFPALDIVVLEGREQMVFDRYAALVNLDNKKILPPPLRCCLGVSTGVSSKDIQDIQKKFDEQDVPIDMVLLQEGYPLAMGDWFRQTEAVPRGIPDAAAQIRAAGFRAGIRLAPFLCSAASDFFQGRKDCLLRDQHGQLITIKTNEDPGYSFYVLDFYNKTVTDYLTSLFQALTQQWSYHFISLDYLYITCLHPPAYKTMGQVMCEALNFLRQCCNNAYLLAGRIPLGAAFGRVDYAELASYPISQWKSNWLAWNNVRERNTMRSNLPSQINRRHIHRRIFQQAPALLLPPAQLSQYSLPQQQTLLLANSLCGAGFIIANDNLTTENEELISEFRQGVREQQAQIIQSNWIESNLIQIHFELESKKWIAYLNLHHRTTTIVHSHKSIVLYGFESIVLVN